MTGMRFGLFVPQGWRLDLVGIAPKDQWSAMLRVAQHADRSVGFDSVWVFDHFHTFPVPTDEAAHEAWTLMAALAATTDQVRLGQMCTCMAYRNPAYLAKIAATTDVISGGRVEMGIGAGWYEHEWRAYGYGFPRPGVRLAMLDEGVQIIRELWTTGTATFHGEQYQVDGAICRPLPLQEGGIPLWIAGGGEKVTLRIAATYATHTNFAGILDGFRRKSAILQEHCRDVGTDFDAITRTANYSVVVGETQAEVDDRLAQIADLFARYQPANNIERSMRPFRMSPAVGTTEQVAEALGELYQAGMTYAICYFPDAAYDLSQVELFEKQVIAALA